MEWLVCWFVYGNNYRACCCLAQEEKKTLLFVLAVMYGRWWPSVCHFLFRVAVGWSPSHRIGLVRVRDIFPLHSSWMPQQTTKPGRVREGGCYLWLQVEKTDGILGIGSYGKRHKSERAAPVLSVRLGYARQPCSENSMCQLSPGGISLSHYSKVVNAQ